MRLHIKPNIYSKDIFLIDSNVTNSNNDIMYKDNYLYCNCNTYIDFLNTYYNINNKKIAKTDKLYCEQLYSGVSYINNDTKEFDWANIIIVDLDFNKNKVFNEQYLLKILNFLDLNNLNYKVSSSMRGIHVLLNIDGQFRYSEQNVKLLYEYFFNKFSKILIDLGLNNVTHKEPKKIQEAENVYIVDTCMNQYKTRALTLSYSPKYKLDIPSYYDFIDIKNDLIYKETLETYKKDNVEYINLVDIELDDINLIIDNILSNNQIARIGDNNARISVASLFAYLNRKNDFIKLELKIDKIRKCNFTSIYESMKGKPFNMKYINYSLSYLNKAFNTSYYYIDTAEVEIKTKKKKTTLSDLFT